MKLVRDKIPAIASEQGRKYEFVKYAERGDVKSRFFAKVIEEVGEVFQTEDLWSLIEECGDVFEILIHLVMLVEPSFDREHALDQVLAAMEEKFEDRGGFSEGWVMKD